MLYLVSNRLYGLRKTHNEITISIIVNALVLQSSIGATSFVSEVVFLKMLSRQKKKRAKRHAKYLEVRNDVLESARASYKAEPEKKRTAKRQRYWESPESARLAERVRYGKAKRPCKTNEAIERGLPIKLFKGRPYVNVATYSY